MFRTRLKNFRVHHLAEELSDPCRSTVAKRDNFVKVTLGSQFMNSADSIGVKIAEGSGGSFTDNRRFTVIARGSLFDVKHWLRRACKRGMLSDSYARKCQELIEGMTPKLSAYINSISKKA